VGDGVGLLRTTEEPNKLADIGEEELVEEVAECIKVAV
jgi:hypothetical protein